MLNLPAGFTSMDIESKTQAFIIAITEELNKCDKSIADLQKLVVSLTEDQKKQGVENIAQRKAITELEGRVKALETPKPLEKPKKFSFLDFTKRLHWG